MYDLLKGDFIRRLVTLIIPILNLMNNILPKSKSKIFIYNSKEVYMNNYAIYNYLIDNNLNEKYRIYYSMPNIEKIIINPPENVYLISGLFKSALVYCTSEICFLDNSNLRIKPTKKQMVLNLWHGTPLKRIGFMSKNKDKSLKENSLNAFSEIIMSSNYFKDIYIKSFNIMEEQIKILGQPRLDSLFSGENNLKKIGVNKKEYSKVIMWMTTYRVSYDQRLQHTSEINWSETNLPLMTNMDKVKELNDYLKKIDVMLIVKIHQGSVFSKQSLNSLSNIKIIQDQDYIPAGVQLYSILSDCDALITDYSSVYYDYLLLNRPIGFIIDDIEDYEKVNGFVFEQPLEYMPGHHIKEINNLKSFINDVVTEKDYYKSEREKLNDLANKYQDNLNCKRIVEYACNLT